MEKVSFSLYDTFKVFDPSFPFARYILFQTPVGQAGKTFADTNMLMGGCLPAPQKFIIDRLRIEFLTGTEEDRETLRTGWVGELIVGFKVYWRGPLSSLLLEDWLRKSLTDLHNVTDAKGVLELLDNAMHHGRLNPGGIGTTIESLEAFQLLISPHGKDVPPLSNGFSARFFLDGTLFRQVQ